MLYKPPFHYYGKKAINLSILTTSNLNKTFKNFQLSDVNIDLPEGYIMGLIGANGAGKTTLIKLLMGLYLKDSGNITILGGDPIQNGEDIRQSIGFIFDDPKYYDFRLGKIINIIKPFYKQWDDVVFDGYMSRFQLNKHMRFKLMSRGMKLKFALAIAMSHHAKLLILDEPTSGLDPVFRIEFLGILQEIIESGDKSILFSSHITEDIEKIADYITYLKNGHIVFSASRLDVLNRFSLVKGTSDTIPDIISKHMIAGHVNDYYYEALIESNLDIQPVWEQKETPSLDQIMYYFEMSDQYVISNT